MIYDKSDSVIYKPIAGCPNFTPAEFACKCGICNHIILDLRVPSLLQKVRTIVGRPIVIESGYRCARYNDKLIQDGLPAVKTSRHLFGQAADVSCDGLDGPQLGLYLYMAGFRRIGVAKTWSHGDCGQGEACWKYDSISADELSHFKKQVRQVFKGG